MLTDDEVKRLKAAIFSDDKTITRRARAFVILAMYTALRISDIQQLKFRDVDFDRETIQLYQKKTRQQVTIPMLPVVGNALYDYIRYERPKVDFPYIFVKDPARGYGSGTIYTGTIRADIDQFYQKARIRMHGERRGAHILRHNLANQLLSIGEDQALISSILGHVSKTTMEKYVESNDQMLKACSISIAEWPVDERIFDISSYEPATMDKADKDSEHDNYDNNNNKIPHQ